MDRPRRMLPSATVVLVPGAWHGAWSWAPVVEELTALGVASVAVELSEPFGGSDRDLHTDSDALSRILDGIAGSTVLCGHSYGGMVITEAGLHPSVRRLVYVAAFLPDEQETVLDLALSGNGDFDASAVEIDDRRYMRLVPDRAQTLLYRACDPATASWAVRQLGPHPLQSFLQAPATVAWRQRPSTYVISSEDNMIPPELQHRMAQRAGEAVEWTTDHSPFLSKPELVAHFLAGIARQP